ncbi:MAG: glutathione S-transferase [Algiphilus sp.]|uniref:glutathione S-transferase family protein n=1 Tax=Algiphilus sp. TaxID=1872431 RepID=UPI0032EE6D41
MIVVHHLENSRSQRILWLLEELGADYEVRRYERDRKTMLAPPELKAVHPLGKSPVISEGETVVAESGAITEYLVDRFDDGTLAPARDHADFLTYRHWLHYAEGSIMPLLVMRLIFGQLPKQAPRLLKPLMKGIEGNVVKQFLGPQLDLHLGYINKALEPTGHFVGDHWTAADMLMSFPLEAAQSRAGSRYPAINDFVARAQARPAYQRALERGGPYTIMG